MSQDSAIALEDSQEVTPSFGLVLAALLLGHLTVDALAAIMYPTLGVFRVRLGMTAEEAAWLLGIGPLASGMAQPICALVSDFQHTRRWGLAGLALAGVGICCLGFAGGFYSLAAVYILGMVGVGMFHPVAATTVGYLRQHQRNSAMSLFFVSGMLGGVLGSYFWPRFLTSSNGFQLLPLLMVPALLLVAVTQRYFSQLPCPKTAYRWDDTTPIPRSNWIMVAFLYLAACFRFAVNVGLFYLFLRWAEGVYAAEHTDWSPSQIANAAAPVAGDLNAFALLGMAMGGLVAGYLVRPGKEKLPMVLVPILFSPVIALFPYVSLRMGYGLALLAGIGFASMIPINIALAQKLLPHRANLASSLMMGGAWMVSVVGPPAAQAAIARWGIGTAFLLTALALVVSGLLCIPVKTEAGSAS